MKKERIKTIAIVLLCAVTIFVFTGFMSTEESRREQLVHYTLLESSYEEKERAYDKLKEKYDELEEENSDLRSAYLKGLAYEWLYDMRCHFTEEGYDAELALDAICQREGLSSLNKDAIRIYAYGISQYE